MPNVRTLLALGAIAAATRVQAQTPSSASGYVALLLPENVNPRWEGQDGRFFVQAMKQLAPNVKVDVFNANNDVSTQQRQAEQAVTKGAKAIVIAPIDGKAAAVIADEDHQAGVPTLAYDRMIQSPYTDFWVQASMPGVGRAQAQAVVDHTKDGDTIVMLKGSPTDPNAALIFQGQMDLMKPLFDSGKRKLGYESWVQGWDPAIARREMDQALTKLNNNVQGVIASNDGNAAAAVASLAEQGLAGKVAVSSLDATVQSLQLILLGEQTQTTWRPFQQMAHTTAEVVVALLDHGDIKTLVSGTATNLVGAKVPFVEVPFYSIEGTQGVSFVIEHDPSVTKAAVCTGAASKTQFCQ